VTIESNRKSWYSYPVLTIGIGKFLKLIVPKALPAWLAALLFAASCAAGLAGSVSYSVVWERTLVDGKYQLPRALIRTSDGGYALAGYGSVELVPGGVGVSTGFWTVKFDRDGKVKWQRAFAAEAPKRREEAYTLTETRDGDLLVVGITESDSLAGGPLGNTSDPRSPSISQIGFAVKYGGDGTLLWKKALGSAEGKPTNWFYAVASVGTGHVLAGKTNIDNSKKMVAWALRVIKLNDSGDVIWDRTVPDGDFSIRAESISRKIVPTHDGGFVVAVGPADNNYPNIRKMDIVSDAGKLMGDASLQRAVMLKFDAQGRVIKRAELPGATEHLAFGSNAGGYIVSGYDGLLWYGFFDTDLNLKWKKAITPAMKINAFYPAPDGGFYGVGATSQLAIAHISPSGELRQRTVFGVPDDTEGRDIAPGDTPDEFVVLWSRIPQTRAGLMKLRVPVQ
jgi:hypothetical protein